MTNREPEDRDNWQRRKSSRGEAGALADKPPEPQYPSPRDEAAAGIAADAKGDPVDWVGIARRCIGEVFAVGEHKDVVSAARLFLPTPKPVEAKPEEEPTVEPSAVVAVIEASSMPADEKKEILDMVDPLRRHRKK